MAARTTEFLVTSAAPFQLTRQSSINAIDIYNHGPNNIWVSIGDTALAQCAVGKCRKLAPESSLQWNVTEKVQIYAIAEAAPQVTGAATILTEIE